jgi:hypothetical protein
MLLPSAAGNVTLTAPPIRCDRGLTKISGDFLTSSENLTMATITIGRCSISFRM